MTHTLKLKIDLPLQIPLILSHSSTVFPHNKHAHISLSLFRHPLCTARQRRSTVVTMTWHGDSMSFVDSQCMSFKLLSRKNSLSIRSVFLFLRHTGKLISFSWFQLPHSAGRSFLPGSLANLTLSPCAFPISQIHFIILCFGSFALLSYWLKKYFSLSAQ